MPQRGTGWSRLALRRLLPRFAEIIDSDDPEKQINRHARSLLPPQNETRLRLTFFTYLTFGRNRNSLHYPIHRLGRWDRMAKADGEKRGAPGYRGAGHGHNTSAEVLKKILDSYARHAGIPAGHRANGPSGDGRYSYPPGGKKK